MKRILSWGLGVVLLASALIFTVQVSATHPSGGNSKMGLSL